MSAAPGKDTERAGRATASTPRWNLLNTALVVGVHSFSLPGLWYWPRAVDAALFLGLYLTGTSGG